MAGRFLGLFLTFWSTKIWDTHKQWQVAMATVTGNIYFMESFDRAKIDEKMTHGIIGYIHYFLFGTSGCVVSMSF